MTGSAVAPAAATCCAGASSSSSSDRTNPAFSAPSGTSAAASPPLPAGAASSIGSSSRSSSTSFLAADFFATVFLAAVFFATVFLAAAFLATAFFSGPPSASPYDTSPIGAAAVVAFFAVAVLAATVLVAVRFAGLFAATLLRVRLGASAALTISVTPSSSRIWLRLRRTFFHWVGGIWSASKARRTSSPAICPSAFPRSMSAITDSDSAISGGSVRDVLADTNNLSERWKRLPTPSTVDRSRRPSAGMDRRRRGSRGVEQRRKRRSHSLLGYHLLSHRASPASVTPNLRGPSHTA